MQKKSITSILRWTGLSFLLLLVVLAIHIYMVTRPRIDESTRVMARIDVNQRLTPDEAGKITAWLYRQKGIDHVMVNPESSIAIFTYSPLKANANNVASDFSANFKYPNARRFIPTEKDMKGGCPVATGSVIYKISLAFKNFFN